MMNFIVQAYRRHQLLDTFLEKIQLLDTFLRENISKMTPSKIKHTGSECMKMSWLQCQIDR